jgi:hypothetical protein
MSKESFWDLDFETFKKAKKGLDAQIAELLADIEKQQPQFADDVIDRNEILRGIQTGLDTLGQKLQALQRHGIEALSDEDKMVVVSALEGVKNLLTLMKKISREELPSDGTLSNAVWGKKETSGVPDWNL